jgi:cyclopropane fatty-acyl-phospholipid synthase-like methyltransferase
MQSPKTAAAASRQKEYARLSAQLAHIGWISEGYVQDRGPGAGGACYPWTRKVKGKTVCVALSKEQYEWLKQAIANWRVVQKTLRQMQRLSREELFESLAGPKRRKTLSKRVLGLV